MAVGTLLETYLSRFGIPTDVLSVETIAFSAALDAVARVERRWLARSSRSWLISAPISS